MIALFLAAALQARPFETKIIANPASVYCIEQGGRIEIEKTPEGERGLCMLPDGRRIDEWELFRANHPVDDAPRR
ncbi:MAG: DUF333 domain-containing protein [Hyphomicrobiales bacterium]|nr:DUF333 domain-containing protein [Hyphomicrobiales bacterium]